MNDAFQQLREMAEAKRDLAIKAAKSEYAETLQKIAELQTILTGPKKQPRPGAKSSKPKLADVIYDVLPDDRPFGQKKSTDSNIWNPSN